LLASRGDRVAKRADETDMASKGGKARAEKLSPAERSQIARNAGKARWAKAGREVAPKTNEPTEMPYSMFRGNLAIGDVLIEGHVLSDGRRVLTQREVVRVITRGRTSGALNRYIERLPGADPTLVANQTIQFRIPGAPTRATGYEATLLIEICDLYLAAREAGTLGPRQLGLAEMAETIVRATAKLGIIALIDEATGYQAVRSKQALQLKLQAFIAEDMAEWAQMFPPEFWIELARLEGVKYSPRNRPIRWGKYIMMFVYDAVDPDVGKELRKLNPDPHFRKNHHQWLKQHGREKVNNQVQQVIAIMKLCEDMQDFKRKFAKVFQKGPLQLEMWDELELREIPARGTK
jgi:hypothetical protein